MYRPCGQHQRTGRCDVEVRRDAAVRLGGPRAAARLERLVQPAVALGVLGNDATSGIASCSGPTYSGPDGPAQSISGSCTDRAGNTNTNVTASLKYDATRPTATGSPARGPDVNGWYNQPVALALTGSDATSGIGSCGGSYAGPDGTGRVLTGSAQTSQGTRAVQ